MNRILKYGLISLLAFAVSGLFLFAQDKVDTEHAYVGSKKCMPCHMAPAKGAQYKQWMGTEHAKAYNILGTAESKEVAKEAGIEGDPQKASECLKCHVTGYNAPDSLKTDKYAMADGVGCESCHGPGGDYWKMPVMKGISEGKMDPAKFGLIEPDAENCKNCHNEESPTFKGFDWDEMYPKISHPNPQKEKKE